MEEGRAHEEVALAPAHRGRRLARPVFLAAVALALFSFVAIVSGGEISSGLQQMRDVIGAKERVPIARRRLRDAAAPVWFASLRAASRSERRAREDAQFRSTFYQRRSSRGDPRGCRTNREPRPPHPDQRRPHHRREAAIPSSLGN